MGLHEADRPVRTDYLFCVTSLTECPQATAQSLSMRQMNFEDKVDEISRKPSTSISLADAEEIQATEVSDS